MNKTELCNLMRFFNSQGTTTGKSVDNEKPYTIFPWKIFEIPMSSNAITPHT